MVRKRFALPCCLMMLVMVLSACSAPPADAERGRNLMLFRKEWRRLSRTRPDLLRGGIVRRCFLDMSPLYPSYWQALFV